MCVGVSYCGLRGMRRAGSAGSACRSNARVSQAVRAEREGGIMLKAMDEFAAAMGCRFVYAIVPEAGRVEDIVSAQARRKAEALVARASGHMAVPYTHLTPPTNHSV